MKDIKLINDEFTFADLNIKGLSGDYSIKEKNKLRGFYFYPKTIVINNEKFFLHRELMKRNSTTCMRLLKTLFRILNDPDEVVVQVENGEEIDLSNETIDDIKRVKTELQSGFITINNIKIDLSTYEPDGEYAEIYTDKMPYIFYNLKKYYSVVKGQYTFFLSNGMIKSIDRVTSMNISKDVRLTQKEVESLWEE